MNPLLRSVIDQLNDACKKFEREKRDNPGRPVREIRVLYIDADFYQGRKKRPIGSLNVIQALDALANDVTRFEDFDISDADRVVLSGV